MLEFSSAVLPAPSPYLGEEKEWAETDSPGKQALKQSCCIVWADIFCWIRWIRLGPKWPYLWTIGKEYHIPWRVLLGCLSALLRPWARRLINHLSLWRMASATLDLRLPSQSQDIAAVWLVPNYTAWNIGWIGFDIFHQQVDAVLVSVISTTKINDVYVCVALTVVEHCLNELATESRDIIWYRLMAVVTQWLGR